MALCEAARARRGRYAAGRGRQAARARRERLPEQPLGRDRPPTADRVEAGSASGGESTTREHARQECMADEDTLLNSNLLGTALAIAAVYVLAPLQPPARLRRDSLHPRPAFCRTPRNIVLMRVEKVDKEKNLIIYRKVRTSRASTRRRRSSTTSAAAASRRASGRRIMDWAEPGKTAVFFHNGGASETCIGNYWYQAYAGGEWWNMSHAEPFLLRSFAGKPEKLAPRRHRDARRPGGHRALHGRRQQGRPAAAHRARSSG